MLCLGLIKRLKSTTQGSVPMFKVKCKDHSVIQSGYWYELIVIA